jgi:hypothetical protein
MFMQNNDKKYGFTIATHEIQETIETLWYHVKGKDTLQFYPDFRNL